MLFQKHDMEGTHYNWQVAEEKDVFMGQPSRRTFDKYNGNQVLFLINFYATLSERFTLREARIIENKIFLELPAHAKSEISVFNWIRSEAILAVS
jgi:hypothetical protein